MSSSTTVPRLTGLTVAVAVLLGACAAPATPARPPASPASTGAPAPSIAPSSTATQVPPTALPGDPATPGTPTTPRVTVTATNGNVFIRRGPDLAFNAVGALLRGQSTTALARDVLSEWVEVPMPEHPDLTGWISVQTQFTSLNGELADLPELQVDFWPVGATIRNCTLHQMLLTPGNIILPSVDNFPANDVRVDPGMYVVVDTDVDGYPQVLKVEIREGSAVDVRVDGSGDRRKCPVP